MTKRIIIYSLTLGVICAVAALGVAGTYYMTALKEGADSPIPAKQRVKREEGMKLLFKSVGGELGKVVNPDAPLDQHVQEALRNGKVVAYAAMGSAQGYSSRIRVLVLADRAVNKVLGILIAEQNETPGLGTQVADVQADATWGEVLAGKKNPLAAIGAKYAPPDELTGLSDFQRQFQGEDGQGVAIEKLVLTAESEGIHAISGATISSRAVLRAVREAVQKIADAVDH